MQIRYININTHIFYSSYLFVPEYHHQLFVKLNVCSHTKMLCDINIKNLKFSLCLVVNKNQKKYEFVLYLCLLCSYDLQGHQQYQFMASDNGRQVNHPDHIQIWQVLRRCYIYFVKNELKFFSSYLLLTFSWITLL